MEIVSGVENSMILNESQFSVCSSSKSPTLLTQRVSHAKQLHRAFVQDGLKGPCNFIILMSAVFAGTSWYYVHSTVYFEEHYVLIMFPQRFDCVALVSKHNQPKGFYFQTILLRFIALTVWSPCAVL